MSEPNEPVRTGRLSALSVWGVIRNGSGKRSARAKWCAVEDWVLERRLTTRLGGGIVVEDDDDDDDGEEEDCCC